MNTQNRISDAVNSLWASFIEKIGFDICNLRIQFNLVFRRTEEIEKHELIFEGVSSFFFVNGEGDRRFNTSQWENAELSEIYYFEKPSDLIRHTNDKPNMPQYISEPNFYLEIWGAVFMIEAKAIILDGSRYITNRDT
jgi:hypothetical protein